MTQLHLNNFKKAFPYFGKAFLLFKFFINPI